MGAVGTNAVLFPLLFSFFAFGINNNPHSRYHSFVVSITGYRCSILYETLNSHLSQLISLDPKTHGLSERTSNSFTMFFAMTRLCLITAALLLPIYVQAVAFTVDSFNGIAVGKPMNLTWSGDKTVLPTTCSSLNPRADTSHNLSQ